MQQTATLTEALHIDSFNYVLSGKNKIKIIVFSWLNCFPIVLPLSSEVYCLRQRLKTQQEK
jgi:hypothetical protein